MLTESQLLICGPGALKLYLSKCINGSHRGNEIVFRGSSESRIWVLRMLMCGPAALKLYLSKSSKRQHRRNELFGECLFKSNVWVLRVLICGHGALTPVWANVWGETIEGITYFWRNPLMQIFVNPDCWYADLELSSPIWANVATETEEGIG